MVKLNEDIRPLRYFKRRIGAFVSRMKQTHRPVVLMVNRRPELVVQDDAGYQATLDRLARFEAVEAIRLGIAAAQDRRVAAAREALAALQEKLGIRG